MAMITIGLVLIALGLRGYFSAGRVSLTAWIPAFFGLPLLKLGLVALEERRRKVANHIGVVLGLLGFAGTVRGLWKLPVLLSGGQVERPTAWSGSRARWHRVPCLGAIVRPVVHQGSARRRCAAGFVTWMAPG